MRIVATGWNLNGPGEGPERGAQIVPGQKARSMENDYLLRTVPSLLEDRDEKGW